MEEVDNGRLMQAPMCLVENTPDGLIVRDDTVRILSQVKLPMVVVAIVGPYRTGKSFLMNRLMEESSGFALGSTIESKTKGIWAWCRRHPINRDECLLLLDTEGLGDVKKGDENNDNWIFVLSVLLSSTLVYNCLSTLQQDALEKLHYVTQLTDLIKVRTGQELEDGTEFVKFFPSFIWVLRDFTLELEKDGKEITSDEYLMDALKLKRGTGKRVNDYNLPRECISNFFREKRCFVFSRPVQKRELFSRLETVPDSQLDVDFVKQAQHFSDYICTSSRPKSVMGRQLNGSMFCRLLEAYVDTIQSGNIPCMERAIDAMAKIENAKAVQAALEHYKTRMQASVQLPTSYPGELSRNHVTCDREAIEIFMSMSILDEKQEFQTKLQDCIEEEYKRFCDLNRLASQDKCRHIIGEVTVALSKNMAEGVYNKPGGYQEYLKDRERALMQYRQASEKEIMAEYTLGVFLKERDSEAEAILASDKALTEAERIRAEEERAAEISKQRAHAAEEERARQEQLQQDQIKSYHSNLELLQKKMLDEKEKLIAENEKLLEQKLQEQERAIKDELEKVVKSRQQEIRELREEIERDRNERSQIEQRDCSGVFGFLKVAGSFLFPRMFTLAGGIPAAVAFFVAEEAVTGLLNNT
ncbi:hypothetical protein CHS0354_042844 [Potamilus streckersoni]|uniref:GB1/RHD3-type G domain-containing protein n=1 Tax=Potamilus streckersoni TaxID=2493646 RepID=A0AAE0T4U4_9BIVA|nr:hypothetical protein CHS0354_042844 [Potamilus streckersoni]